MLPFVIVWMSLIFGFSAGKMAYDPTISKTPKVALNSTLDTVYSVADTKINIEK